jgi:Holliday junction resolvase RusA-like endonuclease
MTENDLIQLQDNIAKGKKKKSTLETQVDLFGKNVSKDSKEWFNTVFKALTKDKNYMFIRGQVVSKKNNYQAQTRYTGKSICCNAKYDKKTKICTACGNPTKSGKSVGAIGLNKKAMTYKRDSLPYYRKFTQKFIDTKPNSSIAIVGIFFIRKDNRRWDYDNALTMVQDQLTESKMILDDDANQLITIPMGYIVNKTTQGVILKHLTPSEFFKFLLNELK